MRRRALGNVPSSIRLDHGDLLVMDGPTQSEYVYCTASGLQGPRVNPYIPMGCATHSVLSAGVAGCVLPTCAQGLVEPNPVGWGRRKIKCPLLGDWSSFC